MFSCEISKNTISYETLSVAAPVINTLKFDTKITKTKWIKKNI